VEEPPSLADRAARFAAGRAAGRPGPAAEEGGAAPGVAGSGDVRAVPGGRRTAGHSVHVRQDARGRGSALVEPARAPGEHAMTAAVGAAKEGPIRMRERPAAAAAREAGAGSIRVHERPGFLRGARPAAAGREFGRWPDADLPQTSPDAPGAPR